MKSLINLSILSFFILVASVSPTLLLAQANDGGLQLVPRLLAEKDLPDPQAPLLLQLKLKNVKDLLRPVRAIAINDGRILETPIYKSFLDERDVPTYQFEVPSPIAEISYQFFVIDEKLGALSTELHTVRRSCLPSLDLTSIELPSGIQPDDKLKILFSKATLVGEELKQYENILKIVDRVKGLVAESAK